MKKFFPFLVLCSIFVGSLVISEILANKIINLKGIYVPAGVIAYAITFPITDTIGEIWGKTYAKQLVLAGFLTLIVVFLLMWLAIILPAASFWKEEEAFKSLLGMKEGAMRITIASLFAYIVSQYHDVWAFHFWKKVTRGRCLWLRNNASTFVSQGIDTFIFIFIAFYGVFPILPLILGQYLVKISIALLDTPVVYALVHFLKSTKKVSS